MPCVFPPRHYAYSKICAVYYALCVSSQGTTLTLQSELFTMPCVFPTRHYPHTAVCAVYYALCVSSQALPSPCSLCCLLCPVCFPQGTALTLQSVLFTMSCVFPCTHYHSSPFGAVYYALCVSSQALPLLTNVFCLICPVFFLPGTTFSPLTVLFTMPCVFPPGTTITLLCVLFTMPGVFSPSHYHSSPLCAVYNALCVSSQALPLLSNLCCLLCPVFPPRQYPFSAVCAVSKLRVSFQDNSHLLSTFNMNCNL
jgi:hypothetical protein